MNSPTNSPKQPSVVRTGLIGVAATAAALVGGLTVLPAIAGAQDIEPETEAPPTTEAPEDGAQHRHRPHRRGHVAEVVTELLGLTEAEVRAAFLEGQTLAQVAEAQGVSVEALSTALAEEATTHITEAIAAGRITEEQGAERLEGLDERIERFINAERPKHPGVHGRRGNAGHSDVVTDLLGLTPAEIREGFQNGQTLADLAEAEGVSADALVDAIVADVEATVAEKLAAGEISQERADTILDGAEERIEEKVNAERPIREERRGRRGGRMGNTETTSV